MKDPETDSPPCSVGCPLPVREAGGIRVSRHGNPFFPHSPRQSGPDKHVQEDMKGEGRKPEPKRPQESVSKSLNQ